MIGLVIIHARYIVIRAIKLRVTIIKEVFLQLVQEPVIGHVYHARRINGLIIIHVRHIVILKIHVLPTVSLLRVQKPVIRNVKNALRINGLKRMNVKIKQKYVTLVHG